MPKHFIKVTENFICDYCGAKVIGTGYTNHCPICLYSKHVDELIPGDRAANCGGLMKPIASQIKSGRFVVFHQCVKCAKITRNKAGEKDNADMLIKLSANPVKV